MDSTSESLDPMSFDVDEWDENFINEVFQVELGLCSKNAAVSPLIPLPPPNPSTFLLESGDLPSTGFDASESFSPPRELSQRFKLVDEAAPVVDDCVMVEARVSRNEGLSRLGGGRKNKEVERLKKELEHLSKKFTYMEQDYITLKKDRDQKNEQLSCVISQLEAKDAEIVSMKRENSGSYKQNQPHPIISFENKIASTNSVETYNSKVLPTNGSIISEMKRRARTDDQATTSYEAQECSFTEKSNKMKYRKSTGIQTDAIQDDISIVQEQRTLNEQGFVMNLHAIWGLYDKRPGSNLVSKILRTCSTDFLTLFKGINMSLQCNLDGMTNERFSEIALHDNTHSIHSTDSARASRFYQLLMKMRYEVSPLQDFIDALLELCNLDNALGHVSMRILHATLQHVGLDSSCQFSLHRSNVFVGKSNDKSFTGDGAIARENQILKFHALQMTDNATEASPISSVRNLCMDDDLSSSTAMFLPFKTLLYIFEMMQKIIARNVEECIHLEGLLIMSLIMMECKPDIDRDKFGSVKLLQNLSTLMSREAGVLVRKQAVRLLFLLLNCPKMLMIINTGQGDGADMSTTPWQEAFKSMLENIAECLTINQTSAEELKFRRRVIILLAFIAASGKSGFEVLLRPVTSQQLNFLELIIQLLAYEMDAKIPDNGSTQDLCKERMFFIRESLIVLNRLASHTAYSVITLRVLTGSRRIASFTIDVANRLQRKIQPYVKHLEIDNKTHILAEINDLARIFRLRVFTFFRVPSS